MDMPNRALKDALVHVATSSFLVQVLACGSNDSASGLHPDAGLPKQGESGALTTSTATSSTPATTVPTGAQTSGVNSQVQATNGTTTNGGAPSSTSVGTTRATAQDDSTSRAEPSVYASNDAGTPYADADTTTSDETNAETTTSRYDDAECQPSTNERQVVGYGKNTTGGGSATPVLVASFAEATAALDAYRQAFKKGTQTALVVRYTGTFDFKTITDVCAQHGKDAQIVNIKEVENVTFEGAPGSSANFGIKINRAKNVIVRNMTMGLLPGGGNSDAITIEGNGTNGDVEHVWIDHNDLFSSTKDDCDGAGDTEFDGLIDIKKGARYITISYNRLHDHQKTGLLGSSDSDDMDRFVTFHHNWYENVVSRTPLHRFGYVHLFNNYFNRILDSGINVRMGGVALIEANYFSNASNPVTSRYSDSIGYWDLRDNYVGGNIKWTQTSDTLANASDWKSTIAFPQAQLTYDYEPDDAECVKNIVTARAGATLHD